jgi:hypothetical protein
MICSKKTTLCVMILLMTSALRSTPGHAQEKTDKPACKSGERVEIACETARKCWKARGAADELARLQPLCRELRQDKATAEHEASEARGSAKTERDRADRAEERNHTLELELHEEKNRIKRGEVVGWTALVLCSAAAGYGASQRDWKLVAGASACVASGGVIIWRW